VLRHAQGQKCKRTLMKFQSTYASFCLNRINFLIWWSLGDSNPWPLPCHGGFAESSSGRQCGHALRESVGQGRGATAGGANFIHTYIHTYIQAARNHVNMGHLTAPSHPGGCVSQWRHREPGLVAPHRLPSDLTSGWVESREPGEL
jgi:hypothetical protein